MREIKFRVWDKSNNRIQYQSTDGRMDGQLDWEVWGKFLNDMSSDLVLMQYTGIKDKNGKEIYEGDIVDFDKKEWGGDDNVHIVSWDSENGEWSWGGGVTGDMHFRKIIGNIYENPELLKQIELDYEI